MSQNPKIQPFVEVPECRKCGSELSQLTYGHGWVLGTDGVQTYGDENEALRVQCDTCRFTWYMATKDAREVV